MEETVSLPEIFQIIKKNIILILSTIFIALIIGALVTFFIMTPKYEASTQILVNQAQSEGEEVSTSDLQSSRELINTYNVIITSPAILENVIEESNYEGSVEDLSNSITMSSEEESQVATVTIEDDDPQQAVNLINVVAQTFELQIPEIMDVDNVSILSAAQLENSNEPVSPQPFLNLAIALMLGLLIGVALAFIMEFLDKTIKTEQDIEKQLEMPILGTVPVMSSTEMKEGRNSKVNSRTKTRDQDRKAT